MVTSKPRMIFSRLSADAKATGFSRYVVYLIPLVQAEKLYAAANAPQKKILKIPNAGHNDIFVAGIKAYLTAVSELVKSALQYQGADEN